MTQAPRAPVLSPPSGLEVVGSFEVNGEAIVVLRLPTDDPRWDAARLTPAEREVARLALRGLSNREIAEQRATSPRTVAVQLARVYAKLGAGSRAGLVAVSDAPDTKKRRR